MPRLTPDEATFILTLAAAILLIILGLMAYAAHKLIERWKRKRK